ncbi:MAG: hypothetical protein ABIL58_11540 [Pseudomonadota bacterium]
MMIKLELDGERDLKEAQTFVNVNLILGNRKIENIHLYYELVGDILPKIKSKTIWNNWPGEKPLEIIETGRLSLNDFLDFNITDIPGNTVLSVENPESERNIDVIKLYREGIGFRVWYSHFEWPYNWSIKALFDELKRLHKTDEYSMFNEYEEDLQDEYSAIYLCHKPSESFKIRDLYNSLLPRANELHQKALDNIRNIFYEYPFKAQFIFPDHLKHECEQYLGYFGQFLSDIGIETDTEINRKGKEILFSVAPKDKNEAIERISQAFSIFLTIPALHNSQIEPISTGVENQIKFQRMEAAIHHLKSQLRLAEATILVQQDHIVTLKDYNTNVLVGSLVKVVEKEKESDGVSFFDDLIKLKPYKGKGFEINLPKVIEMVKKIAKQQL